MEQAVVPLGVEQAVLIEACLLEAMIHVGGEDEIVLVPDQIEELPIHRLGRVHIAVDPNIAAPVGPKLLLRRIGVETAGIHVGEAVFPAEVRKVFFESLPAVHEARRRGQTRARADDHSVRFGKGLLQFIDVVRVSPGIVRDLDSGRH